MKERFKKLNNELISIGDGENPPAERLKQPYDIPCDILPRKCIECGKLHNMCVTDTIKETHTPLEKCYDCFWKNAFKRHQKLTEDQLKAIRGKFLKKDNS